MIWKCRCGALYTDEIKECPLCIRPGKRVLSSREIVDDSPVFPSVEIVRGQLLQPPRSAKAVNQPSVDVKAAPSNPVDALTDASDASADGKKPEA